MPLAMDTYEGYGQAAESAFEKVSNEHRLTRGKEKHYSMSQIIMRLQMAVMRGVARQLLRRKTFEDNVKEVEVEGEVGEVVDE